jgi:hypothetical protein
MSAPRFRLAIRRRWFRRELVVLQVRITRDSALAFSIRNLTDWRDAQADDLLRYRDALNQEDLA